MKNYKTTILGALLAVLQVWATADFEHLNSPKTIFSLLVSGGIALLGFLLKDDILNANK
jgi:hypothetical protein